MPRPREALRSPSSSKLLFVHHCTRQRCPGSLARVDAAERRLHEAEVGRAADANGRGPGDPARRALATSPRAGVRPWRAELSPDATRRRGAEPGAPPAAPRRRRAPRRPRPPMRRARSDGSAGGVPSAGAARRGRPASRERDRARGAPPASCMRHKRRGARALRAARRRLGGRGASDRRGSASQSSSRSLARSFSTAQKRWRLTLPGSSDSAAAVSAVDKPSTCRSRNTAFWQAEPAECGEDAPLAGPRERRVFRCARRGFDVAELGPGASPRPPARPAAVAAGSHRNRRGSRRPAHPACFRSESRERAS